ncbi:hypothetical protein ACHAXR_008516 [Thalassiosira sp. AJA248-18]
MSKPAPPPAYTAASVSTDPLSSNDTSTSWLSVGFINDKFSTHCQRAQGRPFLRTGARPAIGQRVELTIILTSDQRERMSFRLSGEVVNDRVLPMPGWDGSFGVAEDTTQGAGGVVRGASQYDYSNAWRPSMSPDDYGANGGSLALAHMIRSFIMQQQPSLPQTSFTPELLASAWENDLSRDEKEKISNAIVQKLGALHGRKVVCEGRLNFDYDIRRGSEEGPWVDAIPFDGRDIWQFTLVADDSLGNLWRADPSSFLNLGPAHRPRCWPWSNESNLPYQRIGSDAPLHGSGPNGAISVHICIGPHGCSGKNHPHSFQAQAA